MSRVEGQNFTILLIEDNAADARLVREALAENKMLVEVETARSGEEALDRLFRRTPYQEAPLPDLILLDLNLPGVDGREVLAQIKGDARLKRIPVVILSTSQADDDIVRSYDLNANAYVVKPLDFDKFVAIVRDTSQFWLTVAVLPDGRLDRRRQEPAP